VPTRDGNGLDSGEELVAQVIPLRRRGEPPQILADEPRGGFDPLDEPFGQSERSVWEQPTAELRRRAPDPGRSVRGWLTGFAGQVRDRPGRFITGAAATAAGIIAVVLLALSIGAFSGRSGTTPRRGSSTALHGGQPATGVTAQVIHHSPPPHHSTTSRRATHKTRARTPAATTISHGRELAAAGGTTSTPASVQDQTAGSQAPASNPAPQQQPAAENTPASNGNSSRSTESAESTSVEREFTFER
jgi:hypothetical protein